MDDILTLVDEYSGKVPKDYRKVPYSKNKLFEERSNEIIEFNKLAKLKLDRLILYYFPKHHKFCSPYFMMRVVCPYCQYYNTPCPDVDGLKMQWEGFEAVPVSLFVLSLEFFTGDNYYRKKLKEVGFNIDINSINSCKENLGYEWKNLYNGCPHRNSFIATFLSGQLEEILTNEGL